MVATSAHVGSLSLSLAPAQFTNAPTGLVPGSLTTYRIVDANLRRLSPASTPLVEVNSAGDGSGWTSANPSGYRIDYLFGLVLFNSPQSAEALVRVSGYCLPVAPVALVRSLSLSIANDVIELQVFGDGYKRRAVALRDFSGELSGLSAATSDLDPGPAAQSIAAAVDSGAPLLAEFVTGGAEVFRAWVKIPELSHKLTPGALYEHTVKFVGHAFTVGSDTAVAWGYGSP